MRRAIYTALWLFALLWSFASLTIYFLGRLLAHLTISPNIEYTLITDRSAHKVSKWESWPKVSSLVHGKKTEFDLIDIQTKPDRVQELEFEKTSRSKPGKDKLPITGQFTRIKDLQDSRNRHFKRQIQRVYQYLGIQLTTEELQAFSVSTCCAFFDRQVKKAGLENPEKIKGF